MIKSTVAAPDRLVVDWRNTGRAGLIALAGLMSGCVSDSTSLKTFPIDSKDSDLQISLTDFRFGSREVGGETVQEFTLANVGVDTYPIRSIRLSGGDQQDFQVGVHALTLQPGDTYSFDVRFQPLSAGQKKAALDIDYDTVEGSGSRETEQLFYEARRLEQDGDLMLAADTYRRYINAGPLTPNKTRAMIKLPVLEEGDIYGTDQGYDLYTGALSLRDGGETEQAVLALRTVVSEYPDSYLADDALYMLGYMQMQDLDQYELALANMERLAEKYPDTSYLDTSQYSKAVILAELGRHQQARDTLDALLEKHSSLEVLDIRWPKDNYVSRMWVKKAETLLATLP